VRINVFIRRDIKSWVWWGTLVISGLGRLTQEDGEFLAILGYTVRP
jgi:hypothetical protein